MKLNTMATLHVPVKPQPNAQDDECLVVGVLAWDLDVELKVSDVRGSGLERHGQPGCACSQPSVVVTSHRCLPLVAGLSMLHPEVRGQRLMIQV